MDLDDLTIDVWNKADDCNCVDEDCDKNHKLCGICKGTIIYGAHESVQPRSRYAWNTDHIWPKSRGGGNGIGNLQVVHVTCNQTKAGY